MNILDRLYVAFFPQISHERRLKEMVRRGLKIGKRVYINTTVIIDDEFPWLISIGDRCSFSANVVILAHDASPQKYLDYVKIDKVAIGSRTFIGAGSIILPGVSIGTDVIVGAGSVVTHDIPDNSVAAGNPARVIESTSEFIEKHRKNLPVSPRHIRGKTLERPEIRELIQKALNDGPYYV
ncbi:MAG: DapH/DapD/GlmU-related protein [Candidatus Bathyarchaeia archaeon]